MGYVFRQLRDQDYGYVFCLGVSPNVVHAGLIPKAVAWVVAERIGRISRFPLPEAERLVQSIRARGAKLAVPGLVDLSDFTAEADGVARLGSGRRAGATFEAGSADGA